MNEGKEGGGEEAVIGAGGTRRRAEVGIARSELCFLLGHDDDEHFSRS